MSFYGAFLGVWLAFMATLLVMRAECAVAWWLEMDDSVVNAADYQAAVDHMEQMLKERKNAS